MPLSFDLIERAASDFLAVRNGPRTPEFLAFLSFHTASIVNGLMIATRQRVGYAIRSRHSQSHLATPSPESSRSDLLTVIVNRQLHGHARALIAEPVDCADHDRVDLVWSCVCTQTELGL